MHDATNHAELSSGSLSPCFFIDRADLLGVWRWLIHSWIYVAQRLSLLVGRWESRGVSFHCSWEWPAAVKFIPGEKSVSKGQFSLQQNHKYLSSGTLNTELKQLSGQITAQCFRLWGHPERLWMVNPCISLSCHKLCVPPYLILPVNPLSLKNV